MTWTSVETGFSRQTLIRLAAEYGIALREGPQDSKRKGVIDRDWLFEQYVDRGRTRRHSATKSSRPFSDPASKSPGQPAASLTRSGPTRRDPHRQATLLSAVGPARCLEAAKCWSCS
jgi:hypothetical protein